MSGSFTGPYFQPSNSLRAYHEAWLSAGVLIFPWTMPATPSIAEDFCQVGASSQCGWLSSPRSMHQTLFASCVTAAIRRAYTTGFRRRRSPG